MAGNSAYYNGVGYFSHQNKRPGVINGQEPEATQTYTAEEIAERNLMQPPLYLMLSRTGPISVQLSNVVTNEVIYTIRETGRGSMSSKPDYEIFRKVSGDMLVGTIRFGKRSIEVNNKKVSDIETYTTANQTKLKWETQHLRRNNGVSTAKAAADIAQEKNGKPDWCVVLDCLGSNKTEDGKMCGVKLMDVIPNGRFEIFDKDACVDVGGDWALLDELVTISYANMEKARRKCMGASDPTHFGLGGLSIGAMG